MKNIKRFENLVRRAHGEVTPSVDVADRVIAILTAKEVSLEAVSDRPLMWLAAFSSAVAVPALILAVVIYYRSTGPLFEISRAISWVTQ